MRLTPGSEGHQPRMRTTPLEIPQPGIRCQRRDSQSSHSLRYRWSQSEWPPNRQNPTGASGTHVKPPMRQNNLFCGTMDMNVSQPKNAHNGGSVRARREGLRYGPEPFGAHY